MVVGVLRQYPWQRRYDCRSGSLPEILQYRVWPVSRTETFNTQVHWPNLQRRYRAQPSVRNESEFGQQIEKWWSLLAVCAIPGRPVSRTETKISSLSPPQKHVGWLLGFYDSTRDKDDTTVGVGHSRRYCNTGYDQSQGRRPSTLKCIGPISKGDIEPNHPSEINPNSDSRSRSDGRSRRFVQYRVDQSQDRDQDHFISPWPQKHVPISYFVILVDNSFKG